MGIKSVQGAFSMWATVSAVIYTQYFDTVVEIYACLIAKERKKETMSSVQQRRMAFLSLCTCPGCSLEQITLWERPQ